MTTAGNEKGNAAELESRMLELARELSSSGPSSASAWQAAYRVLMSQCETLSVAMERQLGESESMHLAASLLIPIAKRAFRDEKSRMEYFNIAQSMGIHIVPAHFSISPIPNTAALPDSLRSQRFDRAGLFSLNPEAQLELLDRLAPYIEELAGVPSRTDSPGVYYWDNPAFGALDAAAYYSMIRTVQPNLVLEVGSGYSTLIAARAILANGHGSLECVEPYPSAILQQGFAGLSCLTRARVQDIPLSYFGRLEANDILFIDSTHIGTVGSDVHHILFEILPRLRPGVLVHFHDIFLPWNYPESWIRDQGVYWNEQYLLLAMLACNPDARVMLANRYLAVEHGRYFGQRFPHLPLICSHREREVSFWLRWK